MIDSLKPYSAYKASGMPWLGQVPKHWDIKRAKYLFREADDRSVTGDEELLSVSHITGVTPRSQKNITMFLAESNVGHKLCQPDDIVINTMWAWMAALGVARQCGVVSPSYAVYRPIKNNGLLPPYVDHLLRTPAYASEYLCVSTGINTSRLRLYPEQFLRIPILRPPQDEQAGIVRFVAHTDSCIRRYIHAKKKLVALLKDQKQVIIHRAVTRGLDPIVRFKRSGVEWLGDVPEQWSVKRLRYLIQGKLTYGANAAAEYTNPDWPRYLRITDFGSDGALRIDTFRSLPPEIAKDYLVQPGDILLARSGATVGKAFLVTATSGDACHAGYLIRARPRPSDIQPEFLFAFTQSSAFSMWKDSTFIIATIQNIGADKFADLAVPVPPLSEQTAIIQYLRGATATLDAAIVGALREISLFREYRTRFVGDLVTGKLDVRQAAARLPDVVTDVELEDEEPLPEEGDQSDGGDLVDTDADVNV